MIANDPMTLLARVDERTKLMQDRIDDFIAQSQENCARCYEDHERRIRSLERWQWKATGIASAITGFFGAITGLIAGKGGP